MYQMAGRDICTKKQFRGKGSKICDKTGLADIVGSRSSPVGPHATDIGTP